MHTPTLSRTRSYAALPADNQAQTLPQPSAAPSNTPLAANETAPVNAARAGALMRRLSMDALGQAPATSNPQQVTIGGTTHPVNIANGSILGGTAAQAMTHGQTITIDADHPIFSRRRPNQDIMLNKKEDTGSAERSYAWFPKHDADTSKYAENDWPYARADSLMTMDGVLTASLQALLPPGLRAKAAPISMYENMAACGSAGGFIAKQQEYQERLAAHYSKDSIMASHRSVGFE